MCTPLGCATTKRKDSLIARERDSIEGSEHAHSGCVAKKKKKNFNAMGRERELQHHWRKRESFNVRERKRASMLGKEKELQC
jgi:hypothetical protein